MCVWGLFQKPNTGFDSLPDINHKDIQAEVALYSAHRPISKSFDNVKNHKFVYKFDKKPWTFLTAEQCDWRKFTKT